MERIARGDDATPLRRRANPPRLLVARSLSAQLISLKAKLSAEDTSCRFPKTSLQIHMRISKAKEGRRFGAASLPFHFADYARGLKRRCAGYDFDNFSGNSCLTDAVHVQRQRTDQLAGIL